MTQLRSTRLALTGLVVGAVACTPTPNILPTNDLNRPVDIGFMCLGAFDPGGTGSFEVSGRPMRVCHPQPDMTTGAKTTPPGATVGSRTFAFVPNSASGDLSVIDGDSWKLVDLDKATGGYGRAPIGTLPGQMSTSTDGCRLITANRGSCDLTMVDPSTLLAPTLAAQMNGQIFNGETVNVSIPQGNGIQSIKPVTVLSDGSVGPPLLAAPYEAVLLPVDTTDQDTATTDNLCNAQPNGQPRTWRALVTFPNCDLVALMELPSGKILSSAQVKNRGGVLGFTDTGTAPSCPSVECGMDLGVDGGADAGASGGADAGVDGGADGGADAGSVDSTPARPTSIVITPRGDYAYVSMSEVPAILPLKLSANGISQGDKGSIPLHDGAIGSNRIRLGVDPYAFRTAPFDFPGVFVGIDTNHAYLYVIARDGSLRIVDVLNPGLETECETNFDPLHPYDDKTKPAPGADVACIPYGSINRRPSSAYATSGLRFPSIPIDVAAADISRDTIDEDTVNGGYAWVLTTGGTIYLVNITPRARAIKAAVHDGQQALFDTDKAVISTYANNKFVYRDGTNGALVQEPTPYPNRPRDRNFNSYSTALDISSGLPRLDAPPISLATGPYIEQLWTQGTENDATALDANVRLTSAFFPDHQGATAQTWNLIWQGTLVAPRYSGVLDNNTLTDGGGQFCTSGVMAGDIVTLNGCTADSQCPLGMVCLRDPTLDQVPGGFTVTGLCVAQNLESMLATSCGSLVGSLRRYEIADARETKLTLTPHFDEVVRSSLCPCRIGNETSQCGATSSTGTGGAGGAAGAGGMGGGTGGGGGSGGTGGTGGMSGAGGTFGGTGCDPNNDCADPTDGSTCAFECVPFANEGRRCLNRCTKDNDCRKGRICLPLPACTLGTAGTPGDLSKCPVGTSACKIGDPPCMPVPGTSDCKLQPPSPTPVNFCFTDVPCTPGSCLPGQTCLHPDDNSDPKYQRCAFDPQTFCADAPPLAQNACFPQLTGYQVNANASFMVQGSLSGSFAKGTPDGAGGPCRALTPTERDPRLVSRIRLQPAPGQPNSSIECGDSIFPAPTTDPSAPGFAFDHFDPRIEPSVMDGQAQSVLFTARNPDGTPLVDPKTMKPATGMAPPEAPQLVDWMNAWAQDITTPNNCLYLAGPVTGDPASSPDPYTRPTRPQHVRVRFRNTEVAFLLANVDRGPVAANTILFDVHGGFQPQTVINLPTLEISAPARIVLGPVDSNPSTSVNTMKPAPFFFVVDQRRLGTGQGGGPTRGQIIRVAPFGQPTTLGFLPAYEDYTRSGGLFPIQ